MMLSQITKIQNDTCSTVLRSYIHYLICDEFSVNAIVKLVIRCVIIEIIQMRADFSCTLLLYKKEQSLEKKQTKKATCVL